MRRLLPLLVGLVAVPGLAQTDPLDRTFGDVRSSVTTDVDGRFDFVNALAFGSDGKTVAVGAAGRATNRSQFGVARYRADGTLDATFGTDGVVTVDLSTANHSATAALVQADGKVVVGGGADGAFKLVRLNDDGTLDPSFGTDGIVTADPTSGADRSVALFADGTGILAVGSAQSGGQAVWTVRLNADGTLDAGFGAGGVALAPVRAGSGRTVQARAAVRQPDGRIVVGGFYDTAGGTDDVMLVRLTAAGALDAGFGTGGVLVQDLAGLEEFINGVALAPDGKIVGVGRAFGGGRNDYLAARFTAAGALDPSFGTGGVALVDVAGDADGLSGAVVLADGSVLAAGTSRRAGGDDDFGLVRLTPAGAVDTGFGTDGFVRTDFGGTDEGQTAARSPDGAFVVAGYARTADFALAFYTPDGAPLELGRLGFVADAFPDRSLEMNRLTGLPDGRLALAVTADASAGLDAARLGAAVTTAAGAPDAAFGTGGVVLYDGGASFSRALALTSSGDLLVGGFTYPVRDAIAVRYGPTGVADLAFGTGGAFRLDRAANDEVIDLVPLPDGRTLALVFSSDSSRVVRLTASGALDPSFGWGGIRSAPNALRDIDLDAQGRIVATGQLRIEQTSRIVVARFTADGARDATFGTEGQALAPLAGQYDSAQRVLPQPDGGLLVIGAGQGSQLQVVRFQADGTLGPAFGSGGVAPFDLGPPADALALPGGGALVLTTDANGLPTLLRLTAGGTPDPGFGTGGLFTLPAQRGGGFSHLALDAQGRVVVAGNAYDQAAVRTRIVLARLTGLGATAAEPPARAATDLRVVAFPNPSAGRVTVALEGDVQGAVRVEVFDALGRRVTVLHDGLNVPAALVWDAGVPAGVYVVRVTTAGGIATRAVTVVR